MSQVFEKNIRAVQKTHPDLVNRIRSIRLGERYRLVKTAQGWNDVELLLGGNGRRLYGVPDPWAPALAFWARKRLRNPQIVVFCGADLGYLAASYLRAPDPNTFRCFLVEKDMELFCGLLRTVDLSPHLLGGTLKLFVAEPEERLAARLIQELGNEMAFVRVKGLRFITESFSYRANEEYYRLFAQKLDEAVQSLLSSMGNSPHDTILGIENTIANLGVISRTPGVRPLFGRFKGVPAIIVATGPSLDKNYHLLKDISDRALIFSVDASLKFLLNKGINPHFATCLERVPQTLPFFEGIAPEAASKTVLVTAPVVVPEVYSTYRGPHAILYREDLIHFSILPDTKGAISTGPSSANMAFNLAVELGCDPIILVGQDLAYGEEGTTHASAAYWGRVEQRIAGPKVKTFRVPGNTREFVLTNHTWNRFRLRYEADVARVGRTVINATEGGARIRGTRVMTLEEAIRGYVPAGRVPNVSGLLSPPSQESAARFVNDALVRIRGEVLPALRAASTGLEELASAIGRHLAGPAVDSDQYTSTVKRCVEIFAQLTDGGSVLGGAAAQTVQPSITAGLLRHFDVPNKLGELQAIRVAQLRNLGVTIETVRHLISTLVDVWGKVAEAR